MSSLYTVLNMTPSKSSNDSWSATFTEFKRHGTGRSFGPWNLGTKVKAGSMSLRGAEVGTGLLKASALEDSKSRDGGGILVDFTEFRRKQMHTKVEKVKWIWHIFIFKTSLSKFK